LLRVSAATLLLWSPRHPLETDWKTPLSSLQTTTPLCTTGWDFITIEPQNFTDSVAELSVGTCWQSSHHSMKCSFPAHQVNPSAICWKPEPISACAAQMSSKRATHPEHLEGISFTACARRDCAACVRLVLCFPGVLVLLSTCLGLSCAGVLLASRIPRYPAVLLFCDDQTKLGTSSDFTLYKAYG